MRIACALTFVVVAATAHADKPTVAVLGVVPKDASLARSSTALDTALRARAAVKASPYAPKGKKRDIDAKLLAAECSTHEAPCVAKIGAALGADFAIAGTL